MRIEKFVFGPVGTNCYIVINEMTSECFAVDMADCPQEFVKHIKDAGLCVKALLLTHGHFDHIMGAERFAEIFGCPVYAYEGEENILCDPVLNASATMLGQSYVFTKAEYVKADTQIDTAGFQVEIIPTPGHTEGGCCYYIGEEHVLFSGDTLFHNSIGRTDLPTGSGSELVRSVREKLLVLPEDTRVYPGHMEETTISHEKKYNPFIKSLLVNGNDWNIGMDITGGDGIGFAEIIGNGKRR